MLALPAGAIAAPIDYDCDTAAGHFSEISLHQAGPDYRVRGSITPLLRRSHVQYVATATVFIYSADRQRTVAVQIMRGTGSRYEVTTHRVTGGDIGRASLRPVRTGEAVPFELVSTSNGTFAMVGEQRIDLGPPIGAGARLSITCSTGRFRFSGLDWSPD